MTKMMGRTKGSSLKKIDDDSDILDQLLLTDSEDDNSEPSGKEQELKELLEIFSEDYLIVECKNDDEARYESHQHAPD